MAIKNINTDLQIEAGLRDGDGDLGTNNQVLISTGTGINWVDGSGTGIIGGPYLPLVGGTLTGNLTISGGSDIFLADNGKTHYGASNDLEVFHNGSDSYIIEKGTGDLRLQTTNGTAIKLQSGTEDMIVALANSSVSLYHDSIKKLETATTGVTVTGELEATTLDINGNADISGNLTVDGGSITVDQDAAGAAFTWKESDGTTVAGQLRGYANRGDIYLYSDGTKTTEISATSDSFIPALHIGGTSAASGGVLQVTGTATATTFSGDLNGTINTATTAVTKPNATDDTTVATTAFVQNLIETIPAGLVFQGTWNAATNTPTLASGTGTTGHFYIVSTDGSTNLDGITDWKVGDWAVFVEQGATDAWEKVDNSSVLDGSGTGNQITKWAGSGTSNTLTDSIITDNGTNVEVDGTFTATGNSTIQGRTNLQKDLIIRGTDTLANQGAARFYVDSSNKLFIDTANDGSGLVTVDSSGNVGIGTTSPSAKLQVIGASGYVLKTNGDIALTTYTGDTKIDMANNSLQLLSPSGNVQIGDTEFDGNGTSIQVDDANSKVVIAGNVGIGTASPSAKLDVNGNVAINYTGGALASNQISMVGSRASFGYDGSIASAFMRSSDTSKPLVFGSGTSELMRIVSSTGNVGIGTTSPGEKLDVNGRIRGDRFRTNVSGEATFAAYYFLGDADTGTFQPSNNTFAITTAGTERMRVTSAGNVGIGTTTPTQLLHVAGNIRVTGEYYDSSNSSGTAGQILSATLTGTDWIDNAHIPSPTPATPGSITSTIVGETIEIAFNESTTSNIDYYQVWSSDDGGDFGIIAQITPTDFSSTMTVVDTTFVTGGTMSYRVYAVKSGVYSSPGTTSIVYTVSTLDVTDMTVINLNTAYYIQYEKPASRFIDHIEIYMDSQTTQGALNRSNASIVYSGQNPSFMKSVGVSNNFHQFWVEVVTT